MYSEEQLVKPDYPGECINIGKILRPRGVCGEVKVLPLTDIPGRFNQLDEVYVEMAADETWTLVIEEVRSYKGCVYLRFQGLDSVEAVEALRGKYLQVERTQSPELPENEFYHFEIIGAAVYTEEDLYLGTVSEIIETGAHDIFVVQGVEREYLIPFHPDFVTYIDRKAARITVHPLEGLLDL
ncbi:ribosome maturation factor rimM [Candidatus Vecturithrix granuli]|uniref:Ribosome maturation factor RimM n=1 Tax=Vecturithrix granuli TaxID=1499967 RepID=A0A081BUE9_VECG1|nr:ribosome maturation factor rimM [Candidatus Vecturithrix granuli]